MRIFAFFFVFFLMTTTGFAFLGHNDSAKVELLAQVEHQGSMVKLTVIGRTQPGFHVYSVKPQGEFGPKPTRLIIDQPQLKTMGPIEESKPMLMVDQAIGESLLVHQGEFWVAQTFAPTQGKRFIQGYLFYQLCDNLICLTPVKQPFEARLP